MENRIEMKIAWGLFGIGKFASEYIVPSFVSTTNVKAIGSRSEARASQLSEKFGVSKAYGSYEDLLDDGEITHVYIGVPNSEHLHWCQRALKQGKIVLCEKPFAVSSIELDRFWAQSNESDIKGRLFVGWMYRHHRRWQKAMAIISSGELGEIQYINYYYSYFDTGASPSRSKASLGGGALTLVGCYGLHIAQRVFGEYPEEIKAIKLSSDPGIDVDTHAAVALRFGDRIATISTSIKASSHQSVQIVGSDGSLSMQDPINAPNSETTIIIRKAERELIETIPADDQFARQIEWVEKNSYESKDYRDYQIDVKYNPRLIAKILSAP